MKKTLTANFRTLLLLGIFFVGGGCPTGCTKDDSSDLGGDPLSDKLPFRFATTDYNPSNTYYILNDDEPSTVFFDASQRSFYVDQPLQLSMTDDYQFMLRFYSPRALPNVTIWAKMDGYDEQFKLLHLEKVMPFQELHVRIPFDTKDLTTHTRSGRKIVLMANPHLSAKSIEFEIECDAPYWKTLQEIKTHWRIWYSDYGMTGNWLYPLRVYHAREAVAIGLNMCYMFSTDDFAKALKEWGPLHSNAAKAEIDKDALLKKALAFSGLRFGHCTTVYGLGGGNTFGLHEEIFYEHYPDDASITSTHWHELGHCFGYGHDGNMTYENTGPGWISLCHKVYTELALAKRLPVYSRRFLHTRRVKGKYSSVYYYPSKYIIEDPELDEIDGGLGPVGQSDTGGNDGKALAFALDYTAVPSATAATFRPKDVYVYGDTMYVVNDADNNYSLEIFNIADGRIAHVKSIRNWVRQNGETETTEQFSGTPNGVTRSNGKIYVSHTGSRTEIFDADDYHFIGCLGNGNWGAGYLQTVHAFDVTAYKGLMLVRDKRHVVVAEEAAIGNMNPLNVYTRSENVGEVAGTYGMAVDETSGILYSTHPSKRIDWFDLSAIREYKAFPRAGNVAYKNVPYALDLYDGRMYVSSNGAEKFCEVDPKTGEIKKNHTTIGDIVLLTPEKFCIRRNTLFIIDRGSKDTPACIRAIPMTELK